MLTLLYNKILRNANGNQIILSEISNFTNECRLATFLALFKLAHKINKLPNATCTQR